MTGIIIGAILIGIGIWLGEQAREYRSDTVIIGGLLLFSGIAIFVVSSLVAIVGVAG
jgi:hypothetical protein